MAALRAFSLAKISKITIEFSCFDKTVASARALLTRVTTPKMKSTNPKCQVTSVVKGDYTPPSIGVTFIDGSQMKFNPQDQTDLSIIEMLYTKSKSIQLN